jgi:putative flippase GtrA
MSVTRQFIRYCIVGVASNATAYGVFLILIAASIEAKVAVTIVYVLVATFSFVVNRAWTFASKGNWLASAARFLLAYGLGYGLNLLILLIFRDHYHYPAALVQAGAVVVVAVTLFLVSKLYIFRQVRLLDVE